MKKSTKIMSVLLAAACAASMTGCGGSGSTATTAAASEAATEAASSEEAKSDAAASTDGKTYNVGICQLVQHEALDAATQGFQDALTELLGEENVKFDLQNASGDSATCATIVNRIPAVLRAPAGLVTMDQLEEIAYPTYPMEYYL